ncbi:hypothetical protein BLA6993_07021 [Burkholderia lata]|uniref:hypothetical protein n=1 Tax=Burkholderia lata (strain ATCC 17760 / DSM 23089 / LMG 22485 / NCIMB 9086 / R18194 / 383) TaxID=482957 RepID=UPI0014546CB2|nr:hypothetical protein [Burkholderia lata]VWC40534.1 hypothetical protein BLA6993_07021 [Burkholderia lata]
MNNSRITADMFETADWARITAAASVILNICSSTASEAEKLKRVLYAAKIIEATSGAGLELLQGAAIECSTKSVLLDRSTQVGRE